jgi:hypothetical protein
VYLAEPRIRDQSIGVQSRWKIYLKDGEFAIVANTANSVSGTLNEKIFSTTTFPGWPTLDIQKIIFGGDSIDYNGLKFQQ